VSAVASFPIVSRGVLRFWPLLAAPLGVALGLGGYTLVYAEGLSYLSDDPEACANCHIILAEAIDYARRAEIAARGAEPREGPLTP
jgi:cytochrome c nitrite reductase small subunit